MIEIDPRHVVLERRTADGRWVLLSSTDVLPGWPLRWWCATCDASGDGFGFLARLDEAAAPAGWTLAQLLAVAGERLAAEVARSPGGNAGLAAAEVTQAAACRPSRAGHAFAPASVTFHPSGVPSPYPWTVARCGEFHLPMCPDPEGLGEGITPEQLLIVIDQMLHDAARAFPHVASFWRARSHVAAALAAEVRRLSTQRARGR